MNKIQSKAKKIPAIFTLIFFLFFIVSCVSVPELRGELKPVYVTNSKPICILEPQFISKPVDSVFQLNGTFGKNSFTLLSYIVADDSGIFISLFNDFGTDMGSIEYDGNSVQVLPEIFPPNFDGEYMISAFQDAFYDVLKTKENLLSVGLDFIVEIYDGENSSQEIRKITKGKKIIEQITIQDEGKIVKIENFLRNYSFTLTRAE